MFLNEEQRSLASNSIFLKDTSFRYDMYNEAEAFDVMRDKFVDSFSLTKNLNTQVYNLTQDRRLANSVSSDVGRQLEILKSRITKLNFTNPRSLQLLVNEVSNTTTTLSASISAVADGICRLKSGMNPEHVYLSIFITFFMMIFTFVLFIVSSMIFTPMAAELGCGVILSIMEEYLRLQAVRGGYKLEFFFVYDILFKNIVGIIAFPFNDINIVKSIIRRLVEIGTAGLNTAIQSMFYNSDIEKGVDKETAGRVGFIIAALINVISTTIVVLATNNIEGGDIDFSVKKDK